jgi:GMP synthase (glutamine-hydrolysing) A subunit
VHDKILILDFGAQYSQLIARRVREAKVYCELHPFDVSESFIRDFAPRGVILSGGPASVYEDATPAAPEEVFKLGVPVLGICYGMQTMAAQLGGQVENSRVREFGYAEVRARGHSKLLDGIQDRINGEKHGLLDVWMSHGDKVTALPPRFAIIASNESTPIAGMADESRDFYARVGRSSIASCTRYAAAATTGTCPTTWRRRSRRSTAKSAAGKCCWDSRAAWIPRSPRRSSIARSARSSPASSWTRGCFG